jgi:hypothetical protein
MTVRKEERSESLPSTGRMPKYSAEKGSDKGMRSTHPEGKEACSKGRDEEPSSENIKIH